MEEFLKKRREEDELLSAELKKQHDQVINCKLRFEMEKKRDKGNPFINTEIILELNKDDEDFYDEWVDHSTCNQSLIENNPIKCESCEKYVETRTQRVIRKGEIDEKIVKFGSGNGLKTKYGKYLVLQRRMKCEDCEQI